MTENHTLRTGSILLLAFVELRNPEPMRTALAALRNTYPDAELIALDTPATQSVRELVPEVDRWVTIPGGIGLGLQYLRHLRRAKLQAVCILYQSAAPHAHLKLELIAAVFGRVRLFQVFEPVPSTLVPIGRLRLWLRIVGKSCLAGAFAFFGGILAACAGIVLSLAGILPCRDRFAGKPRVGERRASD